MRKILTLTLLIFSLPCIATNYIGIDYKHRWLSGRNANGYAMHEVLGTNYNEYEVYMSHRFANNVGLSLGWEQSNTDNTQHTFAAGEDFIGAPQSAGDRSNISMQYRAVNIGVHGYINIIENVEAIGTLGLAVMQAHMTGTLTTSGVTRNLFPSHNYAPVPKIGLAFQYFVFRSLGFRAGGEWTGTNMFHLKITDEDGARRNIKAFRQSWALSFGIVGKF